MLFLFSISVWQNKIEWCNFNLGPGVHANYTIKHYNLNEHWCCMDVKYQQADVSSFSIRCRNHHVTVITSAEIYNLLQKYWRPTVIYSYFIQILIFFLLNPKRKWKVVHKSRTRFITAIYVSLLYYHSKAGMSIIFRTCFYSIGTKKYWWSSFGGLRIYVLCVC